MLLRVEDGSCQWSLLSLINKTRRERGGEMGRLVSDVEEGKPLAMGK